MTATSDPQGVRRRLPKAERRRRILAEARAAFLEAGGALDGASVRSIADRCGVDQALIFRHFGTKEDLYREAVLAPIEQIVGSLVDNAAETPLAESPDARITRIRDLTYNVTVELLALPPDVIRTVARLLFGKHSETSAFYHRTLKPALGSFEAAVERELPHWQHRPFSQQLSVRMLIATCFWVSVEAQVEGTLLDVDEVARSVTDIMLYGLIDPSAR